MRRNPLYSFRDRSAIGIYDVPLNSTIHILDQGDGTPIFVEIIGKSGLTGGSTIGQFLDDPRLYVDLGTAQIIPSELEKIVENAPGGTPHTGWRILGRDASFYVPTGEGAIDLSTADTYTQGQPEFGTPGMESFAVGHNVKAYGDYSIAMGIRTTAMTEGSMTVGRYNDDENPEYVADGVFEVGIGTADYDKRTGLKVHEDGVITAPSCDKQSIINSTDDSVLVTKEYSDDVDGGNI